MAELQKLVSLSILCLLLWSVGWLLHFANTDTKKRTRGLFESILALGIRGARLDPRGIMLQIIALITFLSAALGFYVIGNPNAFRLAYTYVLGGGLVIGGILSAFLRSRV